MTDAAARFETVLRFAAARGISDIHVKPHQKPLYRRMGQLISRKDEPTYDEVELGKVARDLVPARLAARFDAGLDVCFAHSLVGSGRFRVTLLRQNGAAGIVVRVVPAKVSSLRELNLPKNLALWCQPQSGLVLVCGAHGSGRSSTWAALVEQINTSAAGSRHIVTIEDPIEALIDDKTALVRQRELGTDTPDLPSALQGAARQDVDVVAIAEWTPDAFEAALSLCEEGRLVLASLPAAGTVAALRRIVEHDGRPHEAALRRRLARVLVGAVAQTLVVQADGQSRVPATEVLVGTAVVSEFLRSDADFDKLERIMAEDRSVGMHTLDQSLFELMQSGRIALDAGLAAARRPEELRAHVAGARAVAMTAHTTSEPPLF